MSKTGIINRLKPGKKKESNSNPTCSICNQQGSLNNVIFCSSCGRMVHRNCCEGTTVPWTCSQCTGKRQLTSRKSSSTRSKSSKASSSRQRELQLKRLEEEKTIKLKELELAVEREFLSRKYKLLEELESDDDLEDSKSKAAEAAVVTSVNG